METPLVPPAKLFATGYTVKHQLFSVQLFLVNCSHNRLHYMYDCSKYFSMSMISGVKQLEMSRHSSYYCQSFRHSISCSCTHYRDSSASFIWSTMSCLSRADSAFPCRFVWMRVLVFKIVTSKFPVMPLSICSCTTMISPNTCFK